MTINKETPKTSAPKAKVKAKVLTKIIKGPVGSPTVSQLPSTFEHWKDGQSKFLTNLDLQVFTVTALSDALMDKLTIMAEEEITKIVKLLRKRIRARSKKLDLGCRVM